MATTPNIGLYKPDRNDDVEVDVSLAQNFEKIDVEINKSFIRLDTVERDVSILKTSGTGTGGSGTPSFVDGGTFLDTYASQTTGLDGGEF